MINLLRFLYQLPINILLLYTGLFSLVYFGVPSYISWRYDVSTIFSEPKIKVPTETQGVYWYFWIPVIGRILIHLRALRLTKGLEKELAISLVENTVLYFIVGLLGSIVPSVDFKMFYIGVWLIAVIIIPVEYLLTIKYPKLFMSDGDVDYVEYVSIFYHAIVLTFLGYFLGGLIL